MEMRAKFGAINIDKGHKIRLGRTWWRMLCAGMK